MRTAVYGLKITAAFVAQAGEARTADAGPDLDEILSCYNAAIIEGRTSIESLTALQTMLDPQEDGTTKRAEAELVYSPEGGMERRVIFSNISHPAGKFTLDSLIGPELHTNEYALELAGCDTVDGQEAYRVAVTALERDSMHFDGTVWISTEDFGPVRVMGQVADPPFPVALITLDKAFEPSVCGVRLLRRHSGEAEVNLLLGRKRGLRHIFYDDYVVGVRTIE
ncbi:hypothetical protein K8S17_05725 [bacterium]|nr:hypothetical protein [bacterium]